MLDDAREGREGKTVKGARQLVPPTPPAVAQDEHEPDEPEPERPDLARSAIQRCIPYVRVFSPLSQLALSLAP